MSDHNTFSHMVWGDWIIVFCLFFFARNLHQIAHLVDQVVHIQRLQSSCSWPSFTPQPAGCLLPFSSKVCCELFWATYCRQLRWCSVPLVFFLHFSPDWLFSAIKSLLWLLFEAHGSQQNATPNIWSNTKATADFYLVLIRITLIDGWCMLFT